MTTVELPQLLRTHTPNERPSAMEKQWVAIDGLGTCRNILYTTSVFLSRVAKVASIAIPGFQVLAGGLITYNALKYNIPNVLKEYREVKAEDIEGKRVTQLSVVNQLCYGSFGPAFLAGGGAFIASMATKGAVSATLAQTAEIAAGGVRLPQRSRLPARPIMYLRCVTAPAIRSTRLRERTPTTRR